MLDIELINVVFSYKNTSKYAFVLFSFKNKNKSIFYVLKIE